MCALIFLPYDKHGGYYISHRRLGMNARLICLFSRQKDEQLTTR